jgi:hypothetical protein
MTAVKDAPAALPWINVCDVPGAALDIGQCRFPEDQAVASLALLLALGEQTGALTAGLSGYVQSDAAPESLRTLRDVDPVDLEATVRRIQRMHPTFALDAPDGIAIRDRIAVHFGRGQRKWQRERLH